MGKSLTSRTDPFVFPLISSSLYEAGNIRAPRLL